MANGWFTRRAIGLHLTLAVVVPTFVLLCRWQVSRALAGNDLSWAYVFEWPFFAAYAVYLWWKLLHEDPATSPASVSSADGAITGGAPHQGAHGPDGGSNAGGAGPDVTAEDPSDEELAAYNRYLARLNAADRPKRW